jgi:hypothetical protein
MFPLFVEVKAMSGMVFSLRGYTNDFNVIERSHQTSLPFVEECHFNVDTRGRKKVISDRGFK